MPQNATRITVISPNFNYGKYFPEYWKGIRSQKRQPDRVVIVDDGSTDNSLDLIKEELEKNPPPNKMEFHIIEQGQNLGPSAARNFGIKEFLDKTDIFWIMDSDDLAYPEKLSKSIEVMKNLPHVHVVYSDYDTYNLKENKKTREFKEPYNFNRLTDECIVCGNSIFTAKIFKDIGLYDERLRVAEDWDLWLRISEKGMIYHIPEALFQYNITGEGATFSQTKETWNKCWQQVRTNTLQRRGANA